MAFNSLQFLVFFPVVVSLYFMVPHRARWPLLLVASYYFYMCWRVEYALLILITTVVSYVTAIAMDRRDDPRWRSFWLASCLAINLGILFVFKYFNFFSQSFYSLANHFNLLEEAPGFDLLLPIGISFYTFQTLSYTIDVFRKGRQPERHFGIFALYVSFFPQLVAGPIERSTRLLPQLFEEKRFDPDRVTRGLKQIGWGYFKKIVIADRLALVVNPVYENVSDQDGFSLAIATIFFAYQIYCDFSGYSDIAIGSARVMGYDLMSNFNRPYHARSIADFWRRWHISLSSWFRDYLYFPLGGSRVSTKTRWCFNVMVVFLVSGLWHGANWTFVAWGGLHGIYLVIGRLTRGLRERFFARLTLLPRQFKGILPGVQIALTFALTTFAWIFFRADSLSDALLVVGRMATGMSRYL
ncbi:MAG: MBOAT family protein, partial [Proteobacteria bacterium]|nr:MBOAT family protein [Pseudomonadota bacterium]